jgi:hypothetical protein
MIMTNDQKERLNSHVYWHQLRLHGSDGMRYLNNGEIIQFTKSTNTYSNSEYEINNQSNRKIWYSQLARPFFTEDLELWFTKIKFKDGTIYLFKDLDSLDLYNLCKGKQFRVIVHDELRYTFQDINKSVTAETKKLYTLLDIYDYIMLCVKENRIEDIGDLLRTVSAYSLVEI